MIIVVVLLFQLVTFSPTPPLHAACRPYDNNDNDNDSDNDKDNHLHHHHHNDDTSDDYTATAT